jgi:hypothetical protein
MKQYNSVGGSRAVIRVERGPPAPLRDAVAVDVAAVLRSVDSIDESLLGINVPDRRFRYSVPREVSIANVIAVYDEILGKMQHPAVIAKYQGSPGEEALTKMPTEQPVPKYFANVSCQSMYQRKVLSLLGLRNLLLKGPEIFNEMLAKLFSGCPQDYSRGCGPHKMLHFTGNAVDLDTVVLDANRQLKTINEALKRDRKPTFRNAAEFTTSDTCKTMVLQWAQPLVDAFVDELKLSPEEKKARRLEINPDSPIHVAQHNTDRGLHAVWFYSNVGVATFHVNVPVVKDVIGSILRAPFHLAKCYVLCQSLGKSFDEFLEEAVSDSCFNAKWKAIEIYLDTLVKTGTIDDVLYALQHDNQNIFTATFFQTDDDQRTKERNEMLRLVREQSLQGVDPKTKVKRLISEADVDQWIKDTS